MNIIFNEIKNGTLSIDVIGTIGSSLFEEGFDSNVLKQKLDEAENYDTIVLNISSLGGSAYEGLNVHSMLEFEAKKGKKIVCNIIGAVASAAVTIAMAGQERNMLENSLMLVHKVSGAVEGKKEEMEEKIKQMESLNANLVDIYSQKTGMSKDEISNLMDQEKWLSAKEALKMGFITNILKASKAKNKKIDMESIINQINESELPKVMSVENDVTDAVETIEATNEIVDVVEPVVATPVEPEQVIENVESAVADTVTNIADINNLTLELTSKNDTILSLTSQVNELTNKIAELQKTIKNTEINDVLNTAINQTKISANNKESWRQLLETNFDMTKELISKLTPNKASSLTSLISDNAQSDSRLNWSIRDWEKNDPSGLREMKGRQPEKYQKLFNEFYLNPKK